MIKKLKGNLLATATITLTNVNDGAQGEAKDYYDGAFNEGTKYWSTSYTTDTKPNANVKHLKETGTKFGDSILQVQGQEQWLYAKNKYPIEQGKIYKFVFRVRQTQDPLNGSDRNKVYAGATTFDANGNKLSVNNGNYFITSSTGITVSQGWREYVAYISTTTKPAIVNGSNQTLCPAVKAFDTGTKTIKPMFIVNYAGGNGIAQVDGITVEDYTSQWEALNLIKDKLNNNSQEVFDALTNGGAIQGIYMENGQLYINGQYINAKNLRVLDKAGSLTLGIDENGNITIRATTLSIGTKPVATEEKVITEIDKVQVGAANITDNTSFYDGLKGWGVINGASSPVLETGRTDDNSRAIKVTLGNTNGSGITTPHTKCIGGNKYVASCWVKVTKDCKVGQLFKFRDSAGTETNPINATYTAVKANVWTRIHQAFTAPSTAVLMYSTPRIETAIGTGQYMSLTEFMMEDGTKVTGWRPSHNDVEEGKISVGGAIDDVNNSNGQIQYPRLNIQGMVSFTDMDENIMKHYEIKTDAEGKITETLINGATIKTGSVTAEKMEMYNLSVIRRRKNSAGVWESIDTSFNVNEEGHIRASGTFSSFNFNPETKDVGWQIDENGDSVFNNTIVRGRVELPSAGLTDYGSKTVANLAKNTNFRYGTSSWTSLYSGASVDKDRKCDEAYSLRILKTGETTTNYGGARQNVINAAIPIGSKYTISGYYYVADKTLLDGTFACEFKGTLTAGGEKALGAYPSWNKSNCVEGKWTYFSYTVTTAEAFSKAFLYPWVQKNGTVWFSKLKVETGTIATDWSCHLDEAGDMVRFWSGSNYLDRYDAPFQVLQSGTVIATRGEFGGTFTGRIEIGNIKIHDTNTTPGVIEIKNKDDVNTVVKIGEESSFFNSPVFFGHPTPSDTETAATFKITPSTGRLDVLTGGSIVLSNNSNKNLFLENASTGALMKFGNTVQFSGIDNTLDIKSSVDGKVIINIGNFADAGTHDDASLAVDGTVQGKSMIIGPVRIFENLDGDGIDFFIDN